MKLFSLFIVLALLLSFNAGAQEKKETFLIVKEIEHSPVISQGRTGTCWSFSTTSYFESEIMRLTGEKVDLSEMYFVNYAYVNKAKQYLMFHGHNNFGQGGQAHDVSNVIREYGMATIDAFPGKKVDGVYNHSELVKKLKDDLTAANKRRKDFDFMAAIDTVYMDLEKYIGPVPQKIEFNGKALSPLDFSKRVKINADDYIELSSYTHHPFYKQFVLEVPDNWSHDLYYNLPVDELMEVMFYALNSGYSICWDGDVSEKLFQHKNGKADLPKEQIGKVTQEMRQKTFLNRKTTDDHLMHIVGLSKDSEGRTCFYTKNSWGAESNSYGGYLHMTEDFVKLKTIAFMIHKDALPANIKAKLNL